VTNEVLTILSEECAEVIQAASKLQRFGVDDVKNKKRLQDEVGDLIGVIVILHTLGMVNEKDIQKQVKRKLRKLKRWSSIDCLDDIIKNL
jgi:NTP pyrophosphatase (non-canonical NTP hydrolase)